MKRPLLSVYVYGMGGVWLLIDAETPSEVERKFPQLKVFADRPDWMSSEEKDEYVASCERQGYRWDIDSPPTGWLKNLCEGIE